MLAIRCGRVFDGERFLQGGGTVFVDEGRVVELHEGFPAVGDQWQVVEHSDATMLPGLIDTHAHLVTDSGDRALDRVAGYTDDEIDAVVSEGLRRQLAAGVTTVRDLGDRRFCVVDRRDRQRSGRVVGEPEPMILASGPPITSPGGHCAYMGGEVGDRAAIAAAIAERATRGVDVVKVMASGGMNTTGTDVMRPQFSFEDLQFLVIQAHAAGLAVTAHAHALTAVEFAVRAGVDGIEHCSCLTPQGMTLPDDLLERLAASGIFVGGAFGAPPASAIDKAPPNIRALMEQSGLTPEKVLALRLELCGRMYRGGVRFVTGADSGINSWFGHGLIRGSISFFVLAGASIADALAAATSVSALACGIGERKGLLRKGYDADVLVVDGDLQADLKGLGSVRTVLKGGIEVG